MLRVQLTKSSIVLDNGLAPNRRQAIIWTNADPIDWRMYAALGRDELTWICALYKHLVSKPISITSLRLI